MCWWFRLFSSKCLIYVEMEITKYKFSTNLNLLNALQRWIRLSALLEHHTKFILKIKIKVTCILRSILVSQRREPGVLGPVTCVLLYESIFFVHHSKAEASIIISCKFHRVSFFYEQTPNFWKKGWKFDDFFAKILNIFAQLF